MIPFRYLLFLFVLSVVFVSGCQKDGAVAPGTIEYSGEFSDFSEVGMNAPSVTQSLVVKGAAVNRVITVSVTGDFEISLGNGTFSKSIIIPLEKVNVPNTIQVRCAPKTIGKLNGSLTVQSDGIATKSYDLSASGVKILHSFTTFDKVRLAFGGTFSQASTGLFNFPSKPENIERIRMYIKLACPAGGCNAWDVFANIKVKDPSTGKWLEIGRFITPYGVDNQKLDKGFSIDVTDFRSLLNGNVELKSFIETWGADGWLLTVNFEIIEGTPDYKYSAVSEIIQYNDNSLAGIPYGEPNTFSLNKCITIPAMAEKTSFRTIITGWGHATPADPDGRPCAEWCFRSHKILIDGVPRFTHNLNGIGCATNKVGTQKGNWQPDRAGWCPGMEVPVRTDVLGSSLAGANISFAYQLEPWINNMQTTADNKHGYYAISSFVVVKSNTPILPAMVD